MSDKCLVSGKHLIPCSGLRRALMGTRLTPKAKGLFMPARVDLTTGQRGTDIVQLHSGEFIGRGVAMNFCPICGVEIKTWEAPDSNVEVNYEN